MIFNITGSNKFGFFTDANRLCASLSSRAQEGMIIVGAFTQLAKTKPTHSGQKRKKLYSMMDFIRKACALSPPNMRSKANMDLARHRIRDTTMPDETEDPGNSWSANAGGTNEWVATEGVINDITTPVVKPVEVVEHAVAASSQSKQMDENKSQTIDHSDLLDQISSIQMPHSFTNTDIIDVLAYIEFIKCQHEANLRNGVSNPNAEPDASLPNQGTEDQLRRCLNALAHQATQSRDGNMRSEDMRWCL